MPVIEVQREIIPSAPGGTEVWKYPQVDSLTPFYSTWFISWVAYLNQEDSFKDRYAEHIELTRAKLLPPEKSGPHEVRTLMANFGISLEGIALYKMNDYPKLYMPIEGTGNVIGHLAAAFWGYEKYREDKDRNPKDFGVAMSAIFKTWPGQQVIMDAKSMGMIIPPSRGYRWNVAPNAIPVIRELFNREDGRSLLPDPESFVWLDRQADVVYKYPEAPAKVAAS